MKSSEAMIFAVMNAITAVMNAITAKIILHNIIASLDFISAVHI